MGRATGSDDVGGSTDDHDQVVSATIRVSVAIARAWTAITDPDALIVWYAPGCRWDIPSLREGAALRFFNSETDIQHATIARCMPPSELVLRWTPDPSLPHTTLVNSYRLTSVEGGTSITIAQTGYASVPEAQRASWIASDRGAFPAIAAALAAYLG